MKNKLFLFDAFALIYRSYFAFSKNPRINSKGFNTGCVLGFANTLIEILNKEKPTHIAVAFDTAEPTFRHIEYEPYKAQRDAQPEDITLSVPIIKEMLKAFRIPILEVPGFEADDIIGTIAKKAGAKDFEVYMMTPDKDFSQLVDENIFLYRPNYIGKGYETLDVQAVLAKWNIKEIDQVRDILGLQGDAVDNIPGIPGVGEKTAQKLIEEFGSIENLIVNTDKLKGKLKERVEEFGQQGILSKKLATISLDAPIEFNPDACVLESPDKETLIRIFDEMEFRALKNRVFGEEASTTSQPAKKAIAKPAAENQLGFSFDAPQEEENTVTETATSRDTIDTVPHHYHLIDTPELRASLIQHLLAQKEVCFDTETDKLDPLSANLVGLSFSYIAHEAFYVPFNEDRNATLVILEEFKPFFSNTSICKIAQNLKYDVLILQNYGIEVKGPFFDTMLAHYLIQPEMRHNMDVLAEAYLNYTPVSIETLIGKKGKNQGSMSDVDIADLVEYAGEDADITLQLKQRFEPELQENHLQKLFNEVEVPLVEVLATMERHGVKIDEDALHEFSGELEKESKVVEQEIYQLAGEEFNIASPKQLGDILFDKLKLDDKAKKTKTGQYATGEEILSVLAIEHKIADHILTYRELNKLKSTYVDALPQLISPIDGRVHTSYNQAVTATGRLSSVNPNLQNIPIRTERGREIRKAFIKGGEDYVLMSADYSQIELRIMASFSNDKGMTEAFQQGLDIHSATASKVFGVELSSVSSEQRRKAKTVNFGIIYGISAFGLSQRLGIPRKEAGEIIDAYFEQFSGVKTFMDKMINDAREKEYVETLLGRRRYLRDINSRNFTQRGFAERNAINAPIQGSAADMIKIAMIQIHQWLKENKMRSKMILQVHDELVFDVHKSEIEDLQKHIPLFMKNALPLNVPIEVGLGSGDNWLQAH